MIVLNEQCLCEKDNIEYYCNLIEFDKNNDSYIVELSTNNSNKPPIKVSFKYDELESVMGSGHLEYIYDYASRLSKGDILLSIVSEVSIDTKTITTFNLDNLKVDGLFNYLYIDRDWRIYNHMLPDICDVLCYYHDTDSCFEIMKVIPNEKWESFTVRLCMQDIQSLAYPPSEQCLKELMTPKILQHFVSIREQCAEILVRDLGEILY